MPTIRDRATFTPNSGVDVAQSGLIPVKLLLLLDSRSPAGAHSHSGGMESAVAAGWVQTSADVESFCRGRLNTTGRVAAAFAATACRHWQSGATAQEWQHLDGELSARTPSAAARRASRNLGSGLRRLLLATMPDHHDDIAKSWSQTGKPAPHQPLVLGAATALTGGSAQIAARAAALMTCTAPASAAVRLLGLDPYAVHNVMATLAGEIELVGDEAVNTAELPAHTALALDLLADVHARMEVRLFAS
jgi:urease accessory protein